MGLRAFSYNIDGAIGYVINPVLVEVAGEPELVGEGCPSVPGLWHDALRHPRATVTGIDLDGKEIVLEGEGLLAQALQHETDHLDGKLYLDRRSPRPVESRCGRSARASGSDLLRFLHERALDPTGRGLLVGGCQLRATFDVFTGTL